MNNPCYGCIVESVCCKMCEIALPVFKAMVVEDKNFNWDEYYIRRDNLYRDMYKALNNRKNKNGK